MCERKDFDAPSYEEVFERNFNEDVVQNLLQEVLENSEYDDEDFIEEFAEEENLTIEETKQMVMERAIEEVKDDLMWKYDAVIEGVSLMFYYDPVIYRAMQVQDIDKFIDDIVCHGKTEFEGIFKPVGVYWTWNEASAESHWGKGGKKIILKARIDPRDIDIDATFDVGFNYFDENEIRMKKGSKVFLESVCWGKNEELDCRELNILIEI